MNRKSYGLLYRPAKSSDFSNLATFVWQAIFPAFDVDGLTELQREENDRTVEEASGIITEALGNPEMAVFTAWDERRRALAGYTVVDRGILRPGRIVQLIVRRADRSKGIGKQLMELGLEAITHGRAVFALVRYYNLSGQEFFTRFGLVDSGETAGDFEIGRILLYREGEDGYGSVPAEIMQQIVEDDFPTENDEPYFEPVYESLPDHNLATEDPLEWEMDRENSTLDESQLSVLERFIHKAKAKKQQSVGNHHPEIAFEIDYGEPEKTSSVEVPAAEGLGFEFAFDVAPASPAEEILELEELPEEELRREEKIARDDTGPEKILAAEEPVAAAEPTDPRKELEDRLAERLTEYFGADELMGYLRKYRRDEDFRRIRDVALRELPLRKNERLGRLDDLIEYFIVETSRELHQGLFPQKILRYQTLDRDKIDLFALVLDYLSFDPEIDSVYTDFVTAPPKILKNATKTYLTANRGERLYLIYDQTLIGSAKQGFAVTDRAVYWKHVFQPTAFAEYATLREVKGREGHLLINGQYFDAGHRLNLRLALLLNKLHRLADRD